MLVIEFLLILALGTVVLEVSSNDLLIPDQY